MGQAAVPAIGLATSLIPGLIGSKGGSRTEIVQDHTAINQLRQQAKQRSQQIQKLHEDQLQMQREMQRESREKDEKFMKFILDQTNANSEEKMKMEQMRIEEQRMIREKKDKDIENMNAQMINLQKQNLELLQRQPKIIFQQNPQLERELEELKRSNKEQLRELKKFKNPELIVEARENQLQNYLKFLKTKNFQEELVNDFGVLHNVVVGEISAGKTSCLNFFYGLDLATGVDETTRKAEVVVKGEKVCMWDSPGTNQEFDLMIVDTLRLFATAHRVFLFFEKSLKCSKNDLRILNEVCKKGNLYIVRTMCDKFKSKQELENALKKDRELLLQWGLKGLPLYCIATEKSTMDSFDNRTIKNLMDS